MPINVRLLALEGIFANLWAGMGMNRTVVILWQFFTQIRHSAESEF